MVVASLENIGWYSAEMSSLSAQMAALENEIRKGKSVEIHPKHHEVVQDSTALLVRDDKASSCLRAPPPSLRSDSDLEKYFRVNVESRCKNAAAVMTPAAEQSNDSAIQREYDMDTWKMYHRIQSSRRPGVIEESISSSSSRVVSDDDDVEGRRIRSDSDALGVSVHHDCIDDDDDDDMDEIFELELDS